LLRIHLLPRFGRTQLASIDEDAVAALIAVMTRRGYSPGTIRQVLAPLKGILDRAARTGEIPENPMSRLERGERPSVPRERVIVLTSEQIAELVVAADTPLIATALFTGARIAELLALTWKDIDFEHGFVRVRYQLDRRR